jgi:hypothetical protein
MVLAICLSLWMSGLPAMAQQVLPPAQLPDSLRILKSTQLNSPITIIAPIADSLAKRMADTVRVLSKKQTEAERIIPRKATLKSLMLPGLGQAYNRQYWKIPVIYGALGAAVYFFNYNQSGYRLYNAAYAEAYNSTAIDTDYRAKVAVVNGVKRSVTNLKQISDQFQSQRDLTIILTAAGWALQAIEANVAAHLKTFDLSDDISFRVCPTVMPTLAGGPVPGIRLMFNVK